MRQLYVLRHAKSDWGSGADGDHERPLSKRGESATRTLGAFLQSSGVIPERILSSTARRAKDTAERVAASAGWEAPVELERGLYGASVNDAISILQRGGGAASSLLVAGHEPTVSGLCSALIGGGSLRAPTGALFAIELAIEDWSQLAADRGVLLWMVTPRLLASG